MTEAEWLSSTDPAAMLSFLDGTMTRRKVVLWAVDCRRHLATWEFYGSTARAIDMAERWADGSVTGAELAKEYLAAYNAREAAGRMILSDPDDPRPNKGTAGYYAVEATVGLLIPPILCRDAVQFWTACHEATWFGDSCPDHSATKAVRQSFANRLRDVFGNPWRPVAFDPAWRTSTAVGVAQAIYEDRTFDRLPILADALQDAGCEDADLLGHLRGDGPHIRGCWALDLVLGKE